jgi:hypothetical protein
MTQLPRWFDRQFTFAFGVEIAPYVLSRLRGTPARLEDVTDGLGRPALTRRVDGAWSIQENAGHLLDLEPLWAGRVDDLLSGADTLRAADLGNRATHEARHNEADLHDLLLSFREARANLLVRLEILRNGDFAKAALHPRLKQPMRLIDHLFFVAEHDDQHLARIWELRSQAPGQ